MAADVVPFFKPMGQIDAKEAFRQIACMRREVVRRNELHTQNGAPPCEVTLEALDELEAYVRASIEATLAGLPQPPRLIPPWERHTVPH